MKLTGMLRSVVVLAVMVAASAAQANPFAYEPFTNSVGSAIIGSDDGFGFSGAWQANSSSGTATNTDYGLGYVDSDGLNLATAGGAGFFQGNTASSSAMQPIRLFSFSRGTNGVDGGTTWISFLTARLGPTGTLPGNPYGRGANVPHDLNTGALQKLAIGNSSGATSNTVGLIPTGSSANLVGTTNQFGGVTNFIVVRIDHIAGAANDHAYLFVNPKLGGEPAIGDAGAVSLDSFDFSFDRLRIFAGGQSSAQQPYVELILDEYRIGDNYADVAPVATNHPPTLGGLIITNALLIPGNIVLSGTGGSNSATFHLLGGDSLALESINWPVLATNQFDSSGNFALTNPLVAGAGQHYFRLQVPPPPVPMIPPSITLQPTNVVVTAGGQAVLSVTAAGSPVLWYQWFFNSNTAAGFTTNPNLALFPVQTNQAGDYFVVVTNNYGAVTSSVATLTVNPAPPLLPGAYFVATNGNDSNSGTESSPFLTITKGLNTITTSGTIYLRGGTYLQPAKLTLSRTGITNGAIRFWAYPGETPVIDASGNSSDGISVSGRNYHLKGLTIINAGHNGINISGHSNLIEFCTVRANGNTGLHITGGSSGTTYPSYNLILNCDSYLNYDPPIGGNADGFSAKWNLGPGNEFRGCRAWWNSDDGWDLWMGTDAVLIDQCWTFSNGTNYWNDPQFNGNGQGFKLGGNYVGAPHRLVRSVAFRNESNGVDQNNNLDGQTLDNNTSWANKARNYSMAHGANTTPHIARNNISFAGASNDAWTSGTLATNNSWQIIAPTVNASDFLSLDESVATAPRNADGSLPYWTFLRPVPGGRLIDKGVILTEPYSGAAPDLGAFEDGLQP